MFKHQHTLRILICLLLNTTIFGVAFAQKDTVTVDDPNVIEKDAETGGSIGDLISRTTRLQPSPTAMSLARFIDVPVSNYTGIAQLSVPLLTVQEKELQVNISLAYHAGGLKVEDQPGWTGTNWALIQGE